MIKDYQNLIKNTIDWMEKVRELAKTDGYVIGLSGGVDSSVVARLCQKTGSDILGSIMPCGSNPDDLRHAKLLAEKFNIPHLTIDLSETYNQLIKIFGQSDTGELSKLSLANLKARLRMSALYFLANQKNFIVAGTGNRSEEVIGYFTKFGDGGVDILPIGGLFKSEVYQLAEFLDVPKEIINKAPSAGLWLGQKDEEEIGITYDKIETIIRHLDRYLGDWSPSQLSQKIINNKEIPSGIEKSDYNQIIEKVVKNAHKSEPPLLLTRKKLLEKRCLE